jgi:hypothetical protein
LHLEQLDAPMIVDFLEHLEKKRGNSANSRNIRKRFINPIFSQGQISGTVHGVGTAIWSLSICCGSSA